jgi:hypothetical protein
MSDSGNFDSVLELLAKASPRAIPECMMMMIPEAWQDNVHLSDTKRAFYEYNSCIIEPWVSVELLFLFSFLNSFLFSISSLSTPSLCSVLLLYRFFLSRSQIIGWTSDDCLY